MVGTGNPPKNTVIGEEVSVGPAQLAAARGVPTRRSSMADSRMSSSRRAKTPPAEDFRPWHSSWEEGRRRVILAPNSGKGQGSKGAPRSSPRSGKADDGGPPVWSTPSDPPRLELSVEVVKLFADLALHTCTRKLNSSILFGHFSSL